LWRLGSYLLFLLNVILLFGRRMKMKNAQNQAAAVESSREDDTFYVALGWLAALSVSITSALALS
jgi:hypothetical protein